MSSLSGLVCVRNGLKLDYCWREAAFSLVPICDEVVICDADSDDGTSASIFEVTQSDSRIRSINYPWPNPHQDDKFWVKWLNWARQHLLGKMMIQLDADEVLDPGGYQKITELKNAGRCALFQRLNFWKDAQHLAPHNRCCGTMVARLGPTSLYLPSDEPSPAVEPNIRTNAEWHPQLRIFHYGFIRKPDAFVRKSVEVQNMFFGSVDRRITDMQLEGKRWDERDYFDIPLEDYHGSHPQVAHAWLRERGHL